METIIGGPLLDSVNFTICFPAFMTVEAPPFDFLVLIRGFVEHLDFHALC